MVMLVVMVVVIMMEIIRTQLQFLLHVDVSTCIDNADVDDVGDDDVNEDYDED